MKPEYELAILFIGIAGLYICAIIENFLDKSIKGTG